MQIDPMTGEPIDPLTGAPLQQPMQQQMPALSQGPMHDFANSPGWAMANQAVNNMSAMRRGRAPQTSPAQAYQQAVGFNANLRMRREQQQQIEQQRQHQRMISSNADQRAEERADMDANTFHEMDQYVERMGLDPNDFENNLEKFKQWQTAFGGGGSVHSAFTGANGNKHIIMRNGEIRDTGAKGSPGGNVLVDVGGVPYIKRTLPGGEEQMIPLAEWQQAHRNMTLSQEAGAEKRGTERAASEASQFNQANDRIVAAQTALGVADTLESKSKEFLELFKQNKLETGPLNKFIYDVFGAGGDDLGVLAASSIETLLQNLQIVNLAPVTVTELQEVSKLWAQLGKQENINEAVLSDVVERTAKLKERIRKDAGRELKAVGRYGVDGDEDYYTDAYPDLFGGSFDMSGKKPPQTVDDVMNFYLGNQE